MAGGMRGGGHVCQGGCVMGACVVGGGVCVAGETATAVEDTHPTGMHSCNLDNLTTGEVRKAVIS